MEIGCRGAKKWYADIEGPAAAPSESGLACGKGLKFFAGLEADSFAGRDTDLLTGARVAADAGLARLDGEDAEAAKLDAFAAAQSVLHSLEHGFDSLFGVAAVDAGLLYDGVVDIELS